MKRYLIPAFLGLFFCGVLPAAAQKKITGNWEGTLNVGVSLRIVFHISESNGSLSATVDSPDQGAYGYKCDTSFLRADSIFISIKAVNASYTGKWINDSTINGSFTQNMAIPLVLKKTNATAIKRKPQTPVPPFPYKSEDVLYSNADQSLQYGATITIPPGKGPFPAALLITGSGPQNRDEELMGHPVFAVLADYLTRQGFVVLRVDDRGVGKSTGIFATATSADFADDAGAGFDYLLSRPEVDKNKAGLIGHSEGGLVAPMVATARNDVSFVVLLAGPGVPITELMTEQNKKILEASGVKRKNADAYAKMYMSVIKRAMLGTDSTSTVNGIQKVMNDWVDTTEKRIVKDLGMTLPHEREEMAVAFTKTFSTPWFRYFMAFDPTPYLEKMQGKVLAVNGEKDIQVVAGQNLPAIEAALKKSKVTRYNIKTLPGLNHLFQTCKKCTVQEYGGLDETFSPVALKYIGDWLLQYVK